MMDRRSLLKLVAAAPLVAYAAKIEAAPAPGQFIASTGHRFVVGKSMTTGEIGNYICWSDPDGTWDLDLHKGAGWIVMPHYVHPNTTITEERGVVKIRYEDEYAYDVLYTGEPWVFTFNRV
jgi:hypothetical protein